VLVVESHFIRLIAFWSKYRTLGHKLVILVAGGHLVLASLIFWLPPPLCIKTLNPVLMNTKKCTSAQICTASASYLAIFGQIA
jgi:hypothetical protein